MNEEKKYKVLIVDDDKFLLDMYAMKFKSLGHDATVSVGANDALEKLRGDMNPEIILLDIIMPTMDGLELLEVVRKENLAPQAIIVMLTNETDPAKLEKAKALQVNDYIVKATTIPSEVVSRVMDIAKAKII